MCVTTFAIFFFTCFVLLDTAGGNNMTLSSSPATVGQPLTLRCAYIGSRNATIINLYFDQEIIGLQIFISSCAYLSTTGYDTTIYDKTCGVNEVSLTIKSVTQADIGTTWRCDASFIKATPSGVHLVQPIEPAKDLGVESLTLSCQTDNCCYPAPTIAWYYITSTGETVLYQGSSVTLSTSTINCTHSELSYISTLQLNRRTTFLNNQPVTTKFVCGIQHPTLGDIKYSDNSNNVTFAVKSKPIFQYSEAYAGKVGSTAMLICVFDGTPVPSVQRRKDDVIISDESLLPNGYSKYAILSDFLNLNILYIKYLELEDEGDYICRATNAYGDDKGTVRVRVTDTQKVRRPEGNSKPVLQYSRAVSGRVGSTLILLCVFDGFPLPTVQWLKDDVIIPDGTLLPDGTPKYEISSPFSNKHTLNIENLELNDNGDYICRATNDYGVDEGTVRVTVIGDETSEKADD